MTNKTIELFESIIGKKPDAFLHEPVYQVTESELLEFSQKLAAPEAPRQDAIGTLKRVGQSIIFDAIGDPHILDGMEVFAAPLSPDHSGGAGVVVQVCKIGIYGKAYDSPETKRAYTYADQPDNLDAHKLGQAVNLSALTPGGDLIDQGLSLLRALSGEGFGVFEIDKVKELNQ